MLTAKDNSSAAAIERELREASARGRPGDVLPSVRDLSRRHRAGPVTVQRVLTRLVREGVVDARPGAGTFVAERRAQAPADVSWQTVALDARPLPGEGLGQLLADPPPGTVSFGVGYPDESLRPLGLLATATARAARRPGAWGRPDVAGVRELRAWFAADVGASADDVLVVSGGQAALSTVFRSLAVPGDPVVVESPTYVGALEALRFAGLRPVPVPADADGVRPDLLEAALRSTGSTVVYLQTRLANPTGASLAVDRRAAVLAAATAAGAFVVEDDFLHDLAEPGRVPPPLVVDDPDGHVVHVRSLTKALAPSMRVAGLVARGPAMARLRTARIVDDFFVSGVLQEAALGAVTSPGWTRHLAALRRELAARRQAGVRAAAAVPWIEPARDPGGGFLLWWRLAPGVREERVVAAARDAGVVVSAGRPSFAAEPDRAHVRLSLAATPVPTVVEGVGRLAALDV